MDQGALYEIMDREMVMVEFKVTRHWIRLHGRAAGGYGKPMTWVRWEVSAYIMQQRYGDQAHMEQKIEQARQLREFLDDKVRAIGSARSSASVLPGKMQLRGGRGAREAG